MSDSDCAIIDSYSKPRAKRARSIIDSDDDDIDYDEKYYNKLLQDNKLKIKKLKNQTYTSTKKDTISSSTNPTHQLTSSQALRSATDVHQRIEEIQAAIKKTNDEENKDDFDDPNWLQKMYQEPDPLTPEQIQKYETTFKLVSELVRSNYAQRLPTISKLPTTYIFDTFRPLFNEWLKTLVVYKNGKEKERMQLLIDENLKFLHEEQLEVVPEAKRPMTFDELQQPPKVNINIVQDLLDKQKYKEASSYLLQNAEKLHQFSKLMEQEQLEFHMYARSIQQYYKQTLEPSGVATLAQSALTKGTLEMLKQYRWKTENEQQKF